MTTTIMPSRFEHMTPESFRDGNLFVGVLRGASEKAYLEGVERTLGQNLTGTMTITGFGYSQLESVQALNTVLKDIGLPEYSTDGLSAGHEKTRVSGRYTCAWWATHLCSIEDMVHKLSYIRRFTTHSDRNRVVADAIAALRDSEIVPQEQFPRELFFQIKKTSGGHNALWTVDEFPPSAGNIYLLSSDLSGERVSPYVYRTQRDRYDLFLHHTLVPVKVGDIIFTGNSLLLAEKGSTSWRIIVYRVTEILDGWIVTRREYISSATLPAEEADKMAYKFRN